LRRTWLLAGLGLVFIAAIVGGVLIAIHTERPDPALLKLFGDEAGYRLFAHGEVVEAYRVELPEPPPYAAAERIIDSYNIISGPTKVDPIALAALREAVLKVATRRNAPISSCMFIPGVLIRFVGDDDRSNLDLVFCFHCDVMVTHLNGKQITYKSFGRESQYLTEIMKRVFPHDSKIQALPMAEH
jgi:hypothetical protein